MEPLAEVQPTAAAQPVIVTEGVTKKPLVTDKGGGYVEFDNKLFQKAALKELRPDLFRLTADTITKIKTNFGIQFPKVSSKGDVFVRVDVLPNRVYKFDGSKWIELNKNTTDSYLYDTEYVKYLIDKIDKAEYDVDLLSDNEKYQIEEHLRNQQN